MLSNKILENSNFKMNKMWMYWEISIEIKIINMGESFGVMILSEFLEVLNLKASDSSNIDVRDNCIFVTFR